jgi:hypothetical protein
MPEVTDGLRRWVFIFLGVLIGLVIIVTYGLQISAQSTADYTSKLQHLKHHFNKEKIAETQAKVQDISNSLI